LLERFLRLLESYWEEAFAREWERIEPDLAASVTQAGRVIARLHLRNLARTALLAWVLLGAFRFPLGLATSTLLAASLLAVTGFTSALTDIPLIALVQQRIPDRHLAKALGLWEAGIAGAIAIAPVIATTIIDTVGVSTGFMLSGAALIVIGLVAALALNRTKGRAAVPSPVYGRNPRVNHSSPSSRPGAGTTVVRNSDFYRTDRGLTLTFPTTGISVVEEGEQVDVEFVLPDRKHGQAVRFSLRPVPENLHHHRSFARETSVGSQITLIPGSWPTTGLGRASRDEPCFGQNLLGSDVVMGGRCSKHA
jgi:hypothetical protein